ncbi:carbohydrate ABC transporter permease [Kribbella catacumbae]|uniref:carbohydrate ABC transporter permease n=1 Tax=Kribbella catacumbae TaxID=460086 RepID=UPI00036FA69B|nr:carbohydrate ABC transporter permease [Kribbella catacumbae]
MATVTEPDLDTAVQPQRSHSAGQQSDGQEVFAARGATRILRGVVLAGCALLTLFPFYAMVVLSLKPNGGLIFPGSLVPDHLTLDNFSRVIRSNQILRWALNTLVYSGVSVILVLLLSSMAGYAFAKKRFPGKTAIFWSFLGMLMVPYHITLIPLFVIVAKADGVNTYWGLIVPTLANAQATFLMRQFIRGIPDELIDAAKVDGASEIRIFAQIVLPLCKPILATLGLFVFLWHWNDFLWPLVVAQSPDLQLLTTGIAGLMQDKVPMSVAMAGSVVALAPLFIAYLFAQRHFTEGATMSGLKG